MRLVASLIVKDELGRYLEPCVEHLLEFCDEIRVLDDRSTDGGAEWLADPAQHRRGVKVRTNEGASFFTHEGRIRQELLEWTLAGAPTHVLASDADEFVSDGMAVRAACADQRFDAFPLCMEEVWNAYPDRLEIRRDGGWVEHDVGVVWRADRMRGPELRIADRALACGRVPEAVRRSQTGCVGAALLHFGWANQAERKDRHDRYAIADGGRFHAAAHLDSILLPDDRIELAPADWPPALEPYRAAILASARGSTIVVA